MRYYASLYTQFIFQQFKGRLEYRASFVIATVAAFFQQAASLLTIWVVLAQIPTLGGWTLPEIGLLYGLMLLARSLNQMFADSPWGMGGHIQSGDFDRFLVRPINPLFHLLADYFNTDGIGTFLVGLVLVVTAGLALGVFTPMFNIAYAVVAVLSGSVIFTALIIISAVAAFWITDSLAVTELVFGNHRFAYFPLTIYPRGFIFALTWIVPYGFASYYPAAYLLGRDVGALAWLGPFIAAALAVLSYRVWLFGLRHYSSTGS
jgi:ABC-2 type transport system permease protein